MSLLTPKDLDQISIAAEDAKMAEERKLREAKEREQRELEEAFMSRELHPQARERVNIGVRWAAERGQRQLQIMTFPARYCTDGGRAINNFDPEWPKTLEGHAKRAFEFFEKELRPLGYKLHAEIINFPEGLPGDVAIFLKW
jgi:hypothetical protein